MADTKGSALTEITDVATGDGVYMVDDFGGTPSSKIAKAINVVKGTFGLLGTEEFEIREVLHDETLGAAGTFDVSSIPADYDDLLLLLWARGDVAATSDVVDVLFNNDTTDGNYHFQQHYVVAGSVSAVTEGAFPASARIPADSAAASSFGMARIHIPEYASTGELKTLFSHSGGLEGAANIGSSRFVTSWEDGGATAINRITIQPDGHPTDEFLTNSRLRIIGIKVSS